LKDRRPSNVLADSFSVYAELNIDIIFSMKEFAEQIYSAGC